MRWIRGLWRRFIYQRYVSLSRFDEEHRAYVYAESRYMNLREWVEDKRHHETDRPNFDRLNKEAWKYAERCVPIRKKLPRKTITSPE